MNGHTAMADGFFPLLKSFAPLSEGIMHASSGEVRRTLGQERITAEDFAVLLSPAAGGELEAMAGRAEQETLRHFGRARQLFAPLYLANYCTNACVYCGFHAGLGIARRLLEPAEIDGEARALAATGLRKVLALTGDAPKRSGPGYIAEAVAVLVRHFPSVGIEVQALTREEYAAVARAGADSMTMFQETYNPELYARLHRAGPKRDFAFRLDAPHRAALAGMRGITLGALLGLGDWRFDALMTGLHAAWMQRTFPHLEIAVSLPRLRPCSESGDSPETADAGRETPFTPLPVSDREFVQIMTALRCFLPQVGITLSTRERAFLRDKLLPLGVTKLSAGVSTAVGGYARAQSAACSSGKPRKAGTDAPQAGLWPEGKAPQAPQEAVQFVIDDQRSVPEMAAALEALGYQAVFADWLLPDDGALPWVGGGSALP